MPAHPLSRVAVLGIVNGLLPCGLVYAALAASAGFGDTVSALSFMIAFGVASIPVFAAIAWSAAVWLPRLPRRWATAAPIALMIIGLMLIARGVPPAAGVTHVHTGH